MMAAVFGAFATSSLAIVSQLGDRFSRLPLASAHLV